MTKESNLKKNQNKDSLSIAEKIKEHVKVSLHTIGILGQQGKFFIKAKKVFQ